MAEEEPAWRAGGFWTPGFLSGGSPHRLRRLGNHIVIPVSNDPGSGDEVVLRDRRPIPSDVTSLAAARELSPKRKDIPRLVPLDRLSSGQIALFALAGPLIFRDARAHLVLIDEPEQHLHVQWQRLLLPALQDLSPGSQFLIATHSVDILESVLSYERFLLVEDGDPRAVDGLPGSEANERLVSP